MPDIITLPKRRIGNVADIIGGDMKKGESLLVRACLDYLLNLEKKGYPIMATRTNSGKILTRRGYAVQLCRRGYPDITCCVKGKFYGLECKTEHIQTPDQKKMQTLIEKAGGKYIIIRSIKEFKQWLEEVLDGE